MLRCGGLRVAKVVVLVAVVVWALAGVWVGDGAASVMACGVVRSGRRGSRWTTTGMRRGCSCCTACRVQRGGFMVGVGGAERGAFRTGVGGALRGLESGRDRPR